jgi:hypothetical protein
VTLLYFSPREAPYAPLKPDRMPEFRAVFRSGDTIIYAVDE